MVNLVTVVGENTHILPHMLEHYKNQVDKIYVAVYRQHEDDDILNQVEELGIEPFVVFTEEKYNWNRVTEIYNSIKRTKPDDWWIVSDDDELQIYPENIDDIIKECENKGYTFVTGGFLDRIGDGGTFPEVNKDTNLLEAFPYGGFFRYPMSGACPNKVTLMKGSVDVTPGQHYVDFGNGKTSWGTEHPKRFPVEEIFTQVHHFKWDSTCIERLKKVADYNKDYAFSKEYRKMYNAIGRNDWRIDIKNPKYLFDYVNKSPYITYNSYKHWNKVKNQIILI